MTAKKTTYKCGNCGKTGHNARRCPTKGKKPSPPKKEAPAEEEKEAPKAAPTVVNLSAASVDMAAAERPPTSQVKDPGKFRCPNCSQVGVLVIVALPPNQSGESREVMKCEYCHNKAPAHSIITWGAAPDALA